MSYESWKTECGLEKESSWATEAPGTIGNCEFFRFFETDDIWMTPEILDVTGTESTRDKVDYAKGVWQIRGRRISNIEIVPDRIHHLLEGLIGSVTGSGTSGDPYIYPDPLAGVNALPSYTIWKRCGDVYAAVVGAKIHSCDFAFESGILKVSAEIRAKYLARKANTDNPFPSVCGAHSVKQPFVFWGVTVQYGDYGAESEIHVKSASLMMENGLPENDFVSGDRYTTEHTPGVRTVTGSFQVTFDSYDKVEDFIASNEKSIIFVAQNAAGDYLKIEVPRIVHTPDISIEDVENLYRITMPWEAFKMGGCGGPVDLIKATHYTV